MLINYMRDTASKVFSDGLEFDTGGLLQIDSAIFAAHPDPRFGRLLSYWASLAADRNGFPARNSIDPIEVGPHLLPNVFLVDIIRHTDGRSQYRYRLLGQKIIDIERIRAGSYLHEMTQADITDIERHYEAASQGRAYLRRSSLAWRSNDLESLCYSVVVLPLADDGKAPTHLIGLCLYDKPVKREHGVVVSLRTLEERGAHSRNDLTSPPNAYRATRLGRMPR